MSTYAPDLSRYWLPPQPDRRDAAGPTARDDDVAASALRQQFDALVERVNAARSVF